MVQKHHNGRPLVHIYEAEKQEERGSIITFNLLRDDEKWIGFSEVGIWKNFSTGLPKRKFPRFMVLQNFLKTSTGFYNFRTADMAYMYIS